MNSANLMKLEIEHLGGALLLEVNIELSMTKIVAHATGSNITWQADGVTITVPAAAVDALRDALAHLAEQGRTKAPEASESATASRTA